MAGLHFEITGDNSNFIRKLQEVESGVKRTSRQIEESGLGIEELFRRMTRAAAAFGAGFSAKELVSNIVRVRGEFQQLEVAFKTMLGSTEKADALMQQLVKTAAITPFDLQGVANGAKQLLAYGLASDKVNETLIRLGDIAAGLSIPLGDLVYLYGTTMTQGRLFTQDLRQFQGRGIPLADELAKQFGVAKDKVGELVTAGKVGFPEVQKAIESMTDEGGKFGGLMEAQSKTITGQISNIEDAISTMFNEIGKANEGIINDALSGVSWLVENYEKVGKEIAGLVAAYGAYKAALITLSAVENLRYQAALAQMAGLTKMQAVTAVLTEKTKALNKAMLANPYVLVAATVAGLAYGIYKLVTAETAAEKAVRKHREEQEKFQKTVDDRRARVDELLRIIQDETETEFNQIKAYNELKALSPALTEAYSREALAVAEVADTTKRLNEERDRLNYDEIIRNINKYRSVVSELETELENEFNRNGYSPGNTLYLSAKLNGARENLKLWEKELSDYNKLKRQAEEDAKPIEVKLLEAKSSRDQILQEFLAAKKTLEEEQKKIEDFPFYVIPLDVIIRYNIKQAALKEADDNISSLESQQGKSGETYKEAYEKAKQNWLAKKKALDDAKNGSLSDYQKALKEKDEAENTYKSLGGITTGGKQDNRDKEEAEKRLSAQEKLGEELLALERQNQQDDINLKEEGLQKKLKQIDLDFTKQEDAIKKWAEEWKKANKEAGVTDVNAAGLTEKQQKAIDEAVRLNADTSAKAREKVEKEELESNSKTWQEYFIEFGNYQEKRKNLIEKYDDEIAKLQKDSPEYAIKVAEKDRALEQLDEQYGKSTRAMADLFEDAAGKSVTAIQSIIDKYETLVAYLSGGSDVSLDDLKKIGFTDKDIVSIEKGEISIKDVTDAVKGLKNELKGRSPWLSFKADLEGAVKTMKDAKGDMEKIGEGITGIGNTVTSFAPVVKEFGSNIANIFGFEDSAITSAIDAVEGLGQTAAGVGQIMSGDILGGAMAAVSGISSVVSAFAKIHDAKNEKRIQKLQEQIDTLDKSYEKLGKSVEEAYSKDASKLIGQQNKLLEQQKVLIQQQIKEEEAKKKTDKNRIKEWQEQIDEINEVLAENKEKAMDVIFGEDLQSAIENFAEAYADAWASGEDRAQSAKDTVKNMMRQMVTESIKSAMQSSDAMKKIREQLERFYADNVLTDWEQDYIYNMAEELQKELDDKFAWADSLLTDTDDESSERTATAKGIAQASQDSVNELNARFTTIQGHTYSISENMVKLAELQQTQLPFLRNLSYLAPIEENTYYCRRLDGMDTDLRAIKQTLENIELKGITVKA